jgi:ornithine cyclodeaminase/alanine dehydrogenase-like protein (mu-crystallin family)
VAPAGPLPLLGPETVRAALPMTRAIEVLRIAFRNGDPSSTPPRTGVETASGTLLTMPAMGPEGVGVKLVTVTPANPDAGLPLIDSVYVLFDARDQHAMGILDGSALTALRTAAVSGLAASMLARPEAGHLLVFGAGVQARAHVEAMRAVRPITDVVVVARTKVHARRLVDELAADDMPARVGSAEDVARADLICTCTTSPVPVFDGRALAPGAHVTAVGSFTTRTRELDAETMRRGRIVVETRDAALAEAGDITIAITERAITREAIVADLAEVVRGHPVRSAPDDVTVFKSVGLAFEDLAVATAVVRSAT